MKELETHYKKAQQIKLTETEKNFMRANIAMTMSQTPIHSPYLSLSNFLKPVMATMSTLVVIIIGISGVSIGATKAMPGDFLYNMKVNVNEEVAGILISSPKQKLIWQEERVQKRISEIHTLAESGKLTKETNDAAVKALDTSLADLNKNATELATTNPEIVKAVAASIDNNTKTEPISIVEPTLLNDMLPVNAKISDVEVKTDVTSPEIKEMKIAEPEATPKPIDNTIKTEEVKTLEEITSQIAILKSKIAKEKEHLESLTTTKTDKALDSVATPPIQ